MIFSSKKIQFFAGFIFVLSIAWQAGWRSYGFDRENYINIYNGVVLSDEIALQMWYAKDFLNLLIILASNYFSDDPRLAFLVTCILSFYLKFKAIVELGPKHVLIFIFLYAVFLAPGLEFAAMRSGLAIAFIMLAAVNAEKKIYFYLYVILACMSHVSMIVIAPFIHPLINNIIRKNKLLLVVIFLITGFFSVDAVLLLQHGALYENNSGTINAFILPVVTLIIALLIFGNFKGGSFFGNPRSLVKINYFSIVVYCLIAMSFGLTFTIVTAATRYLEVAWCLIMIVAVLRWRASWYSFAGVLLFLVFLSFVNVGRLTWLAIYDPSFL